MLLSAVSALVVAQSSSEFPEGLMNNPVLKQILSTYLCSVKRMGTYRSVPFYVLLCFVLEADFCDNILTALTI